MSSAALCATLPSSRHPRPPCIRRWPIRFTPIARRRAMRVLVGYSAGCRSVRSLLLEGVHPVAVVTIDGTHASKPPAAWQLDVWRELAAEARRGERVWVATCTQRLYVE